MNNSLMLAEIGRRSDNVFQYISSEGISHAKLFYNKKERNTWLLYTMDKLLILKEIFWNDGFLFCEVGSKIKQYKFQILGRSHKCGKDINNVLIKSCYYQVNVTISLIEEEYFEHMANF